MEVAATAATPRRRLPGWAIASALIGLLVAGPLVALPLSFVLDPGAFGEIAESLLGEAITASLVLAVGVGAGTLALGAVHALVRRTQREAHVGIGMWARCVVTLDERAGRLGCEREN